MQVEAFFLNKTIEFVVERYNPNSSTEPDGSVFNIANWTFSEINDKGSCVDNTSCSSAISVWNCLSKQLCLI